MIRDTSNIIDLEDLLRNKGYDRNMIQTAMERFNSPERIMDWLEEQRAYVREQRSWDFGDVSSQEEPEKMEYNEEEILAHLDCQPFRYENPEDGKYEVMLDAKIKLILALREKLVEGGFGSRGKATKGEKVFTKEVLYDDMEKSVEEVFQRLMKKYISLYGEYEIAVKKKLFEGVPEVIRRIKSIPQWGKVNFLRSILGQIEDKIESGREIQKAEDGLSHRQVEVLEKIEEERNHADRDEERERRLKILQGMKEEVKAEWTRKKLCRMIKRIKGGGFLGKSQKKILAEKMDELGILEKWGPFVDRERRMV